MKYILVLLFFGIAQGQCDAGPCTNCSHATLADTASKLNPATQAQTPLPCNVIQSSCFTAPTTTPTVTTTPTTIAATTGGTIGAGKFTQIDVGVASVPGSIDLTRSNDRCFFGDNEPPCAIIQRAGSSPDEVWDALGYMSAGGDFSTYMRPIGGAPVVIMATPTLGTSQTPAPTMTDMLGTIPNGYSVYAATAWRHLVWRGKTGVGKWACHNIANGGVDISQPAPWPLAFDMWTGQTKPIGWVYFAIDPHPCPLNITKAPFNVLLDALQSPLQHIQVNTNDMPEHESAPVVSTAAADLFSVYDATQGLGPWTPGMTMQVDWDFLSEAQPTWWTKLGLGQAVPNGWGYRLWSFNARDETLADGTVIHCTHGDRHRGVDVPAASSGPPGGWPTNNLPFPDRAGPGPYNCFVRGYVQNATFVVTAGDQPNQRAGVRLRPQRDSSGNVIGLTQEVAVP